jgi:uncharacterized protein (DUF433 family)
MSIVTLDGHIETTPNVMGGKPRIVGHRITVEDVVIWHERLGKSVDEIVTAYNLTLADVYAALTYYYDHQSEIDQRMREGKAWIKGLKDKNPSKLNLGGA